MSTARMRLFWVVLAAFGLAAAYCAVRLEVSTSMVAFFSSRSAGQAPLVARQLADSSLSRTMVLTVASSAGEREARRAAADLAARAADLHGIAWVRRGVDDELGRRLYDVLAPVRLYFVSDDPDAALPKLLTDAGLRAKARELRDRLAGPTGILVRDLAPADPWLVLPDRFDALRAADSSGLASVEGQLVTQDGHAVLFLGLAASPFEDAAQRALLGDLRRAFDTTNAAFGGRLTMDQMGVNRFAVASASAIQADIRRIAGLSTVAVVVLLLLVFRSIRYVLLAMVPLVTGFIGALFVSLVAFGEVHGLTLAFGGVLVGVCIDYPLHLFNHHHLARGGTAAAETLSRLWPGLLLASGTTLAGLVGMAFASFPGIRELALFAGAGVAASLVATRTLVTPWLGPAGRARSAHRAIADRLDRRLEAAGSGRRSAAIVLVALGVVCAVGLTRVRWDNDLEALHRVDPELKQEEERVRGRIGAMDTGRFVIASAPTEQGALELNDAVHARLEPLRADGALDGFRSAHALVWSEALQMENRALLTADPTLPDRALAALSAEGFDPHAFEPFREALTSWQAPPLTTGALRAAGAEWLLSSHFAEAGDDVAVVTFLRGVRDLARVEAAATGVGGLFFDYPRFLAETHAAYRREILWLTSLGLAFVIALGAVRYRRPALVIASVVPAVLACATSLALLSIAGVALNLIHALTLLLVLSMGVDYGVFLVESRLKGDRPGVPLIGIAMACATTVCSFGVLSLSSIPALAAIGQTTALGVVLCLALAPLGLGLVPHGQPSRAHAPGGAP